MPAEPRPVRLGMVRLTDAAPIVLAQTAGLFAAEGLAVHIAVEPSWANVADKLAWGLLDGAVMLPPLAIAMRLGLRGSPVNLIVPAGISRNGNAVTVATGLARAVLADGRPDPAIAAGRLRDAMPNARPLRLAVVHAFSTHDLLLRLFLEQGGIDPMTADITVIPPANMPAALAAGQIDGFCAGAPWGGVAAEAGSGRMIAASSAIWPGHPEKCLAVRAAWSDANPEALLQLLRAVRQAGLRCDDPQEAASLAAMLARDEWVGVPAHLIQASLPGNGGDDVDQSAFAARGAGLPAPDDARRFAREMARWRDIPPDAEARAASMYRPDLHAMAAPGLPKM